MEAVDIEGAECSGGAEAVLDDVSCHRAAASFCPDGGSGEFAVLEDVELRLDDPDAGQHALPVEERTVFLRIQINQDPVISEYRVNQDVSQL